MTERQYGKVQVKDHETKALCPTCKVKIEYDKSNMKPSAWNNIFTAFIKKHRKCGL